MRTPKWVVLFCVLSLLSLFLEPLQAYGVSPFSGLEVANSQNPPGAKVFATEATAFVKKYKIQEVVKPEQLLSNPFVYKGKTIAVYLKFIMMISENEALFGKTDNMSMPICIVKGVPNTLFTSGSYTLAIKVLGLTESKGTKSFLGFELDKVAHAEFVGYHYGDIVSR